MECFIFGEMNRASRNKDVDKIKFYGPLASALSFIVHCGNKKMSQLPNKLNVFRGFKANLADMELKYKVGCLVNLQGYTSTS